MNPLEKVKEIVSVLIAKIPQCRPVSVGGSVRDALLVHPDNIEKGFANAKDFDIEIFHAHSSQVIAALSDVAELELVGLKFPVFKVKGSDIDISFPRREVKNGPGHTDFEVSVDPSMTFADAAYRRDFTINAMGYDWATGRILDPYDGLTDLRNKILKPVSERFKEDALRVMRAFKFIARLGFTPAPETIAYSQSLIEELKGYARERLMAEWHDFILNGKAEHIEKAFDFLWATGAIDLYPELKAIKGVVQSPIYHPEGDVLIHTRLCLENYMRDVRNWPNVNKLEVGYAVLAHDLGKADCTVVNPDGRITAHGHEKSEQSRLFLERIFDPAEDSLARILRLVHCHMRPRTLYTEQSSLASVRRLFVAVDGKMEDLYGVMFCDQKGVPTALADKADIVWLKEMVSKLVISPDNKIKPIILGRHLIDCLQMKPSKAFASIIHDMYEAQLDGLFITEEGGIALLKERYSKQ
jgi:tRNA nucleotidyltransferase (CCA-adding enzyme)